jgi:hypothetical protein
MIFQIYLVVCLWFGISEQLITSVVKIEKMGKYSFDITFIVKIREIKFKTFKYSFIIHLL